MKAEKNFYQYLEYELRFDILNLDKLVPQKRGTPLWIKPKFKSFIVKLPLLFKLQITHLYCRKLKEKKNLKNKFLTAPKSWKQLCDVIKCHVINALVCKISVFESTKRKSKMIRFWPTIKCLCYRKISLFCKKLWKKYHRDTFENDTILSNYKRFVLPENQLILQKTVKKIS